MEDEIDSDDPVASEPGEIFGSQLLEQYYLLESDGEKKE